jgi:hypothetical protein
MELRGVFKKIGLESDLSSKEILECLYRPNFPLKTLGNLLIPLSTSLGFEIAFID